MIPLAFSPALFPSSLSRSSVQTSYKREGVRDKQSEKKILYKKTVSGAERRRYTQIHFQTQRERGKKHITKEKEKDIDIPQRWRVTPLLRTAVNTDRGITRRGGGCCALLDYNRDFSMVLFIAYPFFLLHRHSSRGKKSKRKKDKLAWK